MTDQQPPEPAKLPSPEEALPIIAGALAGICNHLASIRTNQTHLNGAAAVLVELKQEIYNNFNRYAGDNIATYLERIANALDRITGQQTNQ